jgi:hypothetical protein
MTPAEKAKELHFNMCKAIATELRYDGFFTNTIHAKQCALIAVDEIIKITWVDKFLITEDYWEEVKQEILAL